MWFVAYLALVVFVVILTISAIEWNMRQRRRRYEEARARDLEYLDRQQALIERAIRRQKETLRLARIRALKKIPKRRVAR